MPGFNLDDYEPVADRIERFWKDHPHGSILTDLAYFDDKHFIVKATVWDDRPLPGETWNDGRPSATGYAEEVIGSTNVNRTSALENCETSAIGRALANLGYAVKNRASREEMAKAQPEPRQRSGGRRGPSQDAPTTTEQARPASEPPAPATSTTNGTQIGSVGKIRSDLLASVKGDAPKAKMIWRTVLESFGLSMDDEIPTDMIGPIETAVKAMPV